MKFDIATSAIGGEAIQTVNAREVHAKLEVKKDFSDWVKAQIKRARLVENKDFVALPQKGEQLPSGAKHSIDYHLTLEAAKHLGMLSGTDQGFEVRQYFIECERKAINQVDPLATLPPEQRALIALMVQGAEIKATQEKQSIEIARINETVAVIEARTQPENKHFTVLGYSNLHGKQIDFKTASKIGRKCADLSREQGMVIGDVSDPRFGKVHSYHETILQAVIDSSLSA